MCPDGAGCNAFHPTCGYEDPLWHHHQGNWWWWWLSSKHSETGWWQCLRTAGPIDYCNRPASRHKLLLRKDHWHYSHQFLESAPSTHIGMMVAGLPQGLQTLGPLLRSCREDPNYYNKLSLSSSQTAVLDSLDLGGSANHTHSLGSKHPKTRWWPTQRTAGPTDYCNRPASLHKLLLGKLHLHYSLVVLELASSNHMTVAGLPQGLQTLGPLLRSCREDPNYYNKLSLSLSQTAVLDSLDIWGRGSPVAPPPRDLLGSKHPGCSRQCSRKMRPTQKSPRNPGVGNRRHPLHKLHLRKLH